MSDQGIYAGPDRTSANIAAGIGQLIQNAQSLGLTWTLRPATVSLRLDAGADQYSIVYDADTAPITANNMTGRVLAPGQRVYGVIVPPAGNYIIGTTAEQRLIGATVVRGSTLQTIPSGVATSISWDAITYDPLSFVGTVPNTTFSIPSGMGGLYVAQARVQTSPGVGAGQAYLQWNVSGFGIPFRQPFGANDNNASATMMYTLIENQTMTVQAFQSTGGGIGLIGEALIYKVG